MNINFEDAELEKTKSFLLRVRCAFVVKTIPNAAT
jgi:hypothetical protein